MSEEDIRRIARKENKPFLDRIMELQDTLKDREEYCDKLEEDRENILIENKKQKEILDKIKTIIKKVQDDEFYINLTNKEKALYEIEELLEEIN